MISHHGVAHYVDITAALESTESVFSNQAFVGAAIHHAITWTDDPALRRRQSAWKPCGLPGLQRDAAKLEAVMFV